MTDREIPDIVLLVEGCQTSLYRPKHPWNLAKLGWGLANVPPGVIRDKDYKA
jgi:hypothetical protein